jgi:hypothetical protein
VDPWLVTTFDYFAKVQSFYTERFGIARGSLGLFLFDQGSTEGPEYDNQEDRIWWPHYPEYFNSSASYPGPWVAAHEYMHAIEYVVYGQPGDCSVTAENCFADNIFGHTFCFSCATHYACGSVQSRKGSWNEALGDAAGELFYRSRYDPAGSGLNVDTPCSPTGPDKEGSITGYIYTLMARDPHAFMNTFRNATITYTGEGLDHAKTVEVFKALWDDVDPPQGVIVDHHPGNWNTSALYSYYITGGVAGVYPQHGAPGVPVLRASPNPVSRTLLVEGVNLPAHLQLQLYDVSGRLIQSRRLQLPPTGSLSTRLATDQLPTGVYFLRTLSDGKEVTPARKVVILR